MNNTIMDKELELDELEAVSGGGFLDSIMNVTKKVVDVAKDMADTVSDPKKIVDTIKNVF